MADIEDIIIRIFQESARLTESFINDNIAVMIKVVDAVTDTLKCGNKVVLFGNGGSAADAQHIAAEFVNRFLIERPPLPAIALTTDSSVITSIANDYGYDEVFSKQIRAIGRAGDIAWGISTSGSSQNVIKGLDAAKKIGMVTVSMTGGNGGEMARTTDFNLGVPSTSTPRIQEIHVTIAHAICEMVDYRLFKRPEE